MNKPMFMNNRMEWENVLSADTQVPREENPEDFKKFEVKGQKNEFVEKIPVVLSCAGLLHDLGNPQGLRLRQA